MRETKKRERAWVRAKMERERVNVGERRGERRENDPNT